MIPGNIVTFTFSWPGLSALFPKDEDRAAALNMIQLEPIKMITNAFLRLSVVAVNGRAIAVHAGHGFGTPYAIEVVKVTEGIGAPSARKATSQQ